MARDPRNHAEKQRRPVTRAAVPHAPRLEDPGGKARILRSLSLPHRARKNKWIPMPHHVLDAELLFLQSLLEGVRLAEISARVDEHEPPPLCLEVATIKPCPPERFFCFFRRMKQKKCECLENMVEKWKSNLEKETTYARVEKGTKRRSKLHRSIAAVTTKNR